MTDGERTIQANGVELCAEAFGNPAHPPILLMAGLGASMLWWDEELCRTLAGGGRFVIRYDQRDTGRSVTYPPGRPGYSGADLLGDALGVLDAFELPAAHLVGVSAGGGSAQLLALGNPDRVRSLVLISTTFATEAGRELPPSTDRFNRFISTVPMDWSDEKAAIDYLVAYMRVLSGGERPFDESATRYLVRRDAERAHNFAAQQNHDLLAHDGVPSDPPASIGAPTLVIHGTADPMFPIEHGEALAEEIPDAELLRLRGAGHGIERADWDVVVPAILAHTSR